ncbi:MAG: trehalose-phosphatase [Candidatus Eisenbacteria sp.]|nr:trehalose-phosphatase [Candidatus Eisenbacteria bacterium]
MTEADGEAIPIQGIPGFWKHLSNARARYLALDYDGTLAPFHENRMKAFPLQGITGCLSAIRESPDTSLAIVSGRPVTELLELMGDVGIMIVGSHGWETLSAGKVHRHKSPRPEQEKILDRATREISHLGLGERVERKVASVAVHTRALSIERAEQVENDFCRLWNADAAAHGMECRRFNGGVELRTMGIDKGTILRELLYAQVPDAFCVYVGDDETDEDAFRAIRQRGFGIKVGQPGVPTLARGWLSDCGAVLEFLREWIRVTGIAG